VKWFEAAPCFSQIKIEEYLFSNDEVWDAGVIWRRGKALMDFAMNQ